MANNNKLSIYLIKDEFADDDQKILKPDSKVLSDIDGAGKVYFEPSSVKVPAKESKTLTTALISVNLYVCKGPIISKHIYKGILRLYGHV